MLRKTGFCLLVIAFTCGMGFVVHAQAEETNCTVRQNSNFVTDLYGMYHTTSSSAECLAKCEEYALSSIASMADSDAITDLSWTCAFDGEDVHTEVLVEDGTRQLDSE